MKSRFCLNWMVLLLVMTLGVLSPFQAVQAASKEFVDVKEGSVYYEPIQAWAGEGIISGYEDGTFKPGNHITRAEAAIILADLFNLNTEDVPATYHKDVKQGVWYSKAINALVDEGISSGISEEKFGPNEKITRAMLARFIVEGYNLELKGDGETPFTDVKYNVWYTHSIKVLYSHGLISGTTPTTFEPNAPMKRADFALLSYNTESKYGTRFLEIDEIEPQNANKITVIFTNDTRTTIELDEPLKDGENELSFTYKGKVFEVTLDYDAPDTEAPVLSSEGLSSYYIQAGLEFILPQVTAADNEDGNVEVLTSIENSSGEEVEKLDTNSSDTYTITYQASDKAGNESEPVVVTVKVKDQVAEVEAKDRKHLNVTLPNGTITDITLETALKHGDNEVSFQVEDEGYKMIVNYDAITPAIEAAEKAIAELPNDINPEDEEVVVAARTLVEEALAMDSSISIKGIEKLEQAEKMIEYFNEGYLSLNKTRDELKPGSTVQLNATVTPELPTMAYSWSSSDPSVATVSEDGFVTAIKDGQTTITVKAAGGKTATSQITVRNKPYLTFSNGTVTINNVIKKVNTSFNNYSHRNVTVEKIEIYENNKVKSVYINSSLKNNGIDTEIGYMEKFDLSISYNFGGLRTTNDNKLKYTIRDGEDTFEYEFSIR
ncbi:S-layer homology domain-containing protein [Halobacillus sp. B29]|uniref:S-layer homology domain-containing protein n=1 Tax=Halobacillus sp. B29 TaxID=3457432 RepID=UPI003FCC6F3E